MIEVHRMFGMRLSVALLACIFATTSVTLAVPSGGTLYRGDHPAKRGQSPRVLDRFVAPDGRQITIYQGYFARVVDPKRRTESLRYLSHTAARMTTMVRSRSAIPDRKGVLAELAVPAPEHPYIDGEVVAVLRPGTRLISGNVHLSHEQLAALLPVAQAPAHVFDYSNDANLNRVLSQFATREGVHLFADVGNQIESMRERAQNAASLLPIENTYVFHITHGHVREAVAALRALPSVAYAGENLRVTTMNAVSVPVPAQRLDLARMRSTRPPVLMSQQLSGSRLGGSVVPTNYDVTSSGQSFLNAPGVNAVAAYDEVTKQFKQLPGAGEVITNVSLGDVDNGLSPSDPCTQYEQTAAGSPTTIVQGNQEYLNFPSLPLIPTYTSSSSGKLDGMGEVCGVDPLLEEVGLDFSVMAALPHQLQRSGEQGSGLTDLLGIAPGARYRLVVPGSNQPGSTDIAGAFLGAALQNPPPNVITASIGFGEDQYGFPSRYVEEDPVVRSAIASIVAKGIVVCIAAGDGLREYTNAAVGPSGGAAPIDVVKSGGTDLNDDQFSTIPSAVVDTGSIAVGGTTLDDVTTNPPYWSANEKYRDQQAYPEVRWNGFGAFASAYGPRVNIAAPSDNILGLYGTAEFASLQVEGGTSAAAPMVAAAAAVAMQVAQATGKPFATPAEVRTFLASTATSVPNVAQADQSIDVGPQLNIGHAVETLMHQRGVAIRPSVARLAVAQRYPIDFSDFEYTTDTDPAAIDLTGVQGTVHTQQECDASCTAFQPITVAPDWEALPAATRFKLDIDGKSIPAPHPWARLYPSTILKIAGLPLYSPQTRSVALTYRAYSGTRLLAEASTVLSFLGNAQTSTGMGPPPVVAPVVTGKTIVVQYDLSTEDPSFIQAPTLYVSVVDRFSIAASGYHLPYSVRLTGIKGTVTIPVSALQGDGIYGIAVSPNLDAFNTSTWAYTRVATAGSARPGAPLLSIGSRTDANLSTGHIIDVPYGASFRVTWDASTVSKATGAMLEISAPGPTLYGNYNPFNNPNGSIRDDNGIDTGSQVYLPLPGVKGTTTIPSSGLLSAEYQAARVIPMAGTTAVGEASDESTIVTHGIQTSDGGDVVGGFEISTQGSDGMLTSNLYEGSQPIGSTGCVSESVAASLEAINLTKNAVGATVKSTSQTVPYCAPIGTSTGPCPPVPLYEYYAMNDLSFDSRSDSAFAVEGPLSQNACNGDALEGVVSSDWVPNVTQYANAPTGGSETGPGFTLGLPPGQQSTPGNTGVLYAEANGEYLYQLGPSDPQTFAARVTPGTPARLEWSTGVPFGNYRGYGSLLGFAAVNPGTYPKSKSPGYAMFMGDQNYGYPNTEPFIDVLNLATGKASTITNIDDLFPGLDGLVAYDPESGLALVPNGSNPPQYVAAADWLSVGFYDFAAGTLYSTVNTTGNTPAAIASMQGSNGLGYVAVLNAFGPDLVGAGAYFNDGNDNVLSGVDVVAPNGDDSFIATSNLLNLPVLASSAWLHFNQKMNRLYVLGPYGDEIQVIPTSGF